MSKNDSLGDRMKDYENITRNRLMRRTPVIIRIDGKAFHTFTKGLKRPFDEVLGDAMELTTFKLVSNIQGAVFGYTQSDEISILLQDWASFETDAWFDNNIQKMVSVAASMATAYFNGCYQHPTSQNPAMFDARIFNIPREEVCNYFIWRQQDATRNSVQMLSQSMFSHNELQGLNNSKLQDKMMLEKNVNWNDLPTCWKRGRAVVELEVGGVPSRVKFMDKNPPIFTVDRNYVERHMDRTEIEDKLRAA